MSGHRRYRRSTRSPASSSSGRSRSTSRSSMRTSTTQTDDDDAPGGGHQDRRFKRSSPSQPARRRSHHSWVLLNRTGARRDGFPGDHTTTSAMSRTSKAEEISVSFELVEPPGTSVLTFDCPRPTTTRNSKGHVIAAHRDVVLLAITSYEKTSGSWNMDLLFETTVIDLFVYQAANQDLDPSRRRRRWPSLLLLPSAGGPVIYSHQLGDAEIGIGIMSCSCTSNGVGDDSPPSFVVAELEICQQGKGNEVCLFRSGSGQWETFQNLHVHGANGGRELRWWSTDAVVPYGRRNKMIWVDYYRGMLLMDLSSSHSQQSPETTNPTPPRLRYVPLPVDRVGDCQQPQVSNG